MKLTTEIELITEGSGRKIFRDNEKEDKFGEVKID